VSEDVVRKGGSDVAKATAVRSFRTCRTALSKTRLGEFAYVLNPYLGCEFGCVYCYATFMARRHAGGMPWGGFVEAKQNFVEVLEHELGGRDIQGSVLLSSVCDPYQPWERELELTRACLKRLLAAGAAVGVLTKSDLVKRDLDILAAIPEVEVGFTISTLDEGLARRFEPLAPSPRRRLDAAARAVEAGIPVWVFVAPVLPPGGADDVLEVVEAAASVGAGLVRVDSMNRKRYIAERMNRELDASTYEQVMAFDFDELKRELEGKMGRFGVEVDFIY